MGAISKNLRIASKDNEIVGVLKLPVISKEQADYLVATYPAGTNSSFFISATNSGISQAGLDIIRVLGGIDNFTLFWCAMSGGAGNPSSVPNLQQREVASQFNTISMEPFVNEALSNPDTSTANFNHVTITIFDPDEYSGYLLRARPWTTASTGAGATISTIINETSSSLQVPIIQTPDFANALNNPFYNRIRLVALVAENNIVTGICTYQSIQEFPNGVFSTGFNFASADAFIGTLGSDATIYYQYMNQEVPPEGDNDPFSPGGTSEPGGGGGTFDDSSDPIPDSSLPTLSAANTGFTRIYNPTLEQVQAMANYLWTDETVIETIWNHIKQFLENPMDAFIGFNLVPCAVPDGGTQEFKVMYIGTGVNMTVAANQFVDVDCGTVTVEPYYGSALDYAPYTKISCFLPYIGQVDLDTDEVMGATLQIKYRIDIVTGSCVAKIFVDGNVVYQYSGHCAINIPFTSADFSNYVSAIISIAKLAVGAAAAGAAGLAAGAASEEPAMQLTGRVIERATERNPATGRQITTGTTTTERYALSGGGGTQASFNALSPSNIANTVGQVMSSKPGIAHAGSFSGNSGYLGVRRPFLDITRPRMCNPAEYGKYNGYPAMLTLQLGNCSGFTQVQQVQLTGLTATNPEQAEILSLLKTGVIL